MKELRPQTDRERELEHELNCTVRRLHNRSVQAMKEQKKLEEECRQATEKLENYREQSRMQRASTDEVLRDVERAKEEFLKLKKLCKEQQDVRDKYHEACKRLLCAELTKDYFKGCYSSMKSQETSCGTIDKLASDSRLEINKYYMVLKNQVRTAMSRENKLREEFKMSQERTKQWENDSCLLSKETKLFDSELRQNEERRLICLALNGKFKAAEASEVAVQNELVLAQSQEEMLQGELGKSSERSSKLKQEISQVDKRKHWLDQLKSTCDSNSSVRELFQGTSIESDQQKEGLKCLLQAEEALFKEIQQIHESTKLLKTSLQIASETMTNLEPKIFRISDQFFQTCPFRDVESLQEQINKARARAQRTIEETDSARRKEAELQRKIRELCRDEKCFQIPVMQMKYGESGECCLSFY